MPKSISLIAERFGCLSVTLEQPFKDCYENQEPVGGYSGPRAARLGASALDAIAAVEPMIRPGGSGVPPFEESSLPAWTLPGYKSPKHEECAWTSAL